MGVQILEVPPDRCDGEPTVPGNRGSRVEARVLQKLAEGRRPPGSPTLRMSTRPTAAPVQKLGGVVRTPSSYPARLQRLKLHDREQQADYRRPLALDGSAKGARYCSPSRVRKERGAIAAPAKEATRSCP